MIHQIHSLELTFSPLKMGAPWKGDSELRSQHFLGAMLIFRECNSCEDIFKKTGWVFWNVGDFSFFLRGVWVYTIESWVSRQNISILPKPEFFRAFCRGIPLQSPSFTVTNRQFGCYNLPRWLLSKILKTLEDFVCIFFHPGKLKTPNKKHKHS